MLFPILLLLTLSASSMAENLVTNPGFEEIVGSVPVRWQVFVEPMEGAQGGADTKVFHGGRCSVGLHNPRRYEKEPANNWSQNIMRPLAGRILSVKGFIKTQAATEASIWVQCCRKTPMTVLSLSSTDDATPVYGTRDWTPVEMRIETPAGTQYLVVRCVLKGQGTAWFDDITIEDVGPVPEPVVKKLPVAPPAGSAGSAEGSAAPTTPAAPPAGSAAPAEGSVMPVVPVVAPIQPVQPLAPKMPVTPKVAVPKLKTTSPLVPLPKQATEPALQPVLEPSDTSNLDAIMELREARKALEESNTALRRANENLTREITELRKQVQALQGQVKELKDRQTAATALDAPADSRPQPATVAPGDPLLPPGGGLEENPR